MMDDPNKVVWGLTISLAMFYAFRTLTSHGDVRDTIHTYKVMLGGVGAISILWLVGHFT